MSSSLKLLQKDTVKTDAPVDWQLDSSSWSPNIQTTLKLLHAFRGRGPAVQTQPVFWLICCMDWLSGSLPYSRLTPILPNHHHHSNELPFCQHLCSSLHTSICSFHLSDNQNFIAVLRSSSHSFSAEEEQRGGGGGPGMLLRHSGQQGNKLEADTENNKVIMSFQLAAVPTLGTAQRIFTTLLISRDEVWISQHAREGTGSSERWERREQMRIRSRWLAAELRTTPAMSRCVCLICMLHFSLDGPTSPSSICTCLNHHHLIHVSAELVSHPHRAVVM